jgi:hypothetical protein
MSSVMAGLFGQRSALAGAGYRFTTPFKPVTRYCRKYWWRLSNFYRTTVMNISPMGKHAYPQGHKQNPTTTPVFSIFLHRQAIAQGISGTLALRFKRRYPAIVVKFAGFEGVL